MSSEQLQNRIDARRRQREEEEEAKKNKLLDKKLTWEADAIIAFENVDFMNEVTDDMDLYNYIWGKLEVHTVTFDSETFACLYEPSHECKNNKIISVRGCGIISPSEYHKNPSIFHNNDKGYLIKVLLERIKSVKESPEYKEKEVNRKRLLEEERIRKQQIYDEERIRKQQIYDEQQRVLAEKLFQEEQASRQKTLDETNMAIRAFIQDKQHTFTDLTLAEWETRHEKQFIVYTIDQEGWSHYTPETYGKSYRACYSGMPSSFENYYEEGKVPFFTKCPTCKAPTKFNYLNSFYPSPWGGGNSQESNAFREVYCDKHYFYSSSTQKHYMANPSGDIIKLSYPEMGQWRLTCWIPTESWSIWDPSDPDGSKAIAEKKRKEYEAIQLQISELRAKQVAEIQRQITELKEKQLADILQNISELQAKLSSL